MTADPESHATAEPDRLEAATEQAIAACGGDARDAVKALKSPAPPIENKGNIDLVAKYYDKLADALGGDQQ